ncbi:MAG: glycosyltransferase family 4 protein [Deltaproteobacteria bacterium]|nr:glycosyltransferase family 4 protein [Deltaproteobacteria bacterium]
MRILVVIPYYKPDGGAEATLFPLLCEEMVKLGHEVTVLTTVPHYPSGRVRGAWRGWKNWHSEEKGVKIVRVGLPSVNRYNLAARLFQFITFQVRATQVGLFLNFDVLLSHTSSLEVGLPYLFLSAFRHKPAVYSIHDIYPDIGINMGVFRNRLLIRSVERLESYCMKRAKKIRILSKSFEINLLNKGVTPSKLALIYDWVDTEEVRPLPRQNNFALEHSLVDRFTIVYVGNIGPLQGLDSVIEAACLVNYDLEIYFVFVGDGAARRILIEKTHQMGIDNVRFIPYQPRERIPEILATSDICLITLCKGGSFGALPSKTYQILASGRALIASVDEKSDMWDLIRRADAGLCVPPEEPSKLAEAILMLKKDKSLRERFGRNGRTWVEQHHSSQLAAKQFEKLLFEAISFKNSRSNPSRGVKKAKKTS